MKIGSDEEIKVISHDQVKSLLKRYKGNAALKSSLRYVIQHITYPEAEKRVKEWRKLEAKAEEDDNIKEIMKELIEQKRKDKRIKAHLNDLEYAKSQVTHAMIAKDWEICKRLTK